MNKTLLKSVISFALIATALFILTRSDYVQLIRNVSIQEFIYAVLICISIFFLSGLKIRVLAENQFKTRIKFIDVVTLPITMNLSSFYVPIKGGLLYLIFLLKMKYKIKFVEGISISATNHLMTIVLYGILGICYIISQGMLLSMSTVIALLFVFCPLIVTYLHKILSKITFQNNSFLGKIQSIVDSIVKNHNELWSNFNILISLFLLSCVHTALRIYWIYLATVIFDLNIPFLAVIAMALLTELSIIIRFLPGNIGIYELLSGGTFQALGQSGEVGILIALFLRMITVMVTFTIGLFALNANLKYFDVDNIKSVWRSLKTAKE